MATGGLLSLRLGQIRRRLRLGAALEGAVAGAALTAVALAAAVAIARARGGALPARDGAALVALALLGAGLGGIARASRRIPLARCARLADAALDGQDRLLSALALAATETPFARALVADAVRRAERLVPGAAVPARRPAGLPALGVAAAALAAAVSFPASTRAARLAPAPAVAARRAPLPADALGAEQEATRAVMAEASRLDDARLAALAAELDRTLRRLADGTTSDGDALDLLRALAARAAGAAHDADRDARAAEAAVEAFDAAAETRAAGRALAQAAAGPADEARARSALAAGAAAHPAETGRALGAAADGLAAAAGGADDADGDAADANEGHRRLARGDQNASPASGESVSGTSDPEARHLERLRRDLDDAASACRDGDPSCAARAGARGADLAQLERQGAARDGLRRLERAAEQLRARLGRGELGGGDAQAMRSFGRAARGDQGAGPGGEPQGPGGDPASAPEIAGAERAAAGDGDGPGQPGGGEAPARAAGAEIGAASDALGVAASTARDDAAGTGSGIGHQPGGAPLGAATPESAARGSEAEVPVADGAGPSRAEVIGTAAGRGFAGPAYARAFADYAAAVEDALGTTALPAGKRYLVRRYFDLIRPRARPPRRAP